MPNSAARPVPKQNPTRTGLISAEAEKPNTYSSIYSPHLLLAHDFYYFHTRGTRE